MKKIQWGGFGVVVVLLVVGVLSTPLARADTVQVSAGEAVTIPGDNVSKIAIADPSVADVVPLSDKELSVIGKKAGVTTLTIVKSDGSATQLHRIEVGNDAAATAIREMVGQTGINVRAVGDTLVLDGHVDNELQAQRAAQIASAYKDKVVNLVEIEKPRQIRIRTRVAEVNTDAIKNVGFRWLGPAGEVEYAMNYQGGGSIISGFVPPASAIGTAPTSFDPNAVSIDVVLSLLLTKGYARLLSEPTLVTFSGKEASFLVGQEIPITETLPNSFTVEFKEVGVRMKIKPVADSQNRINTTIHSEVSQIIGTGAQGIPIIGVKMADTTLQVNDGQTVVIGGLLENNVDQDLLRKVPWLGDIPIFGFLFRHKTFHQAQREVLFFMTPEVIKDVDADTTGAARSPYMKQWSKDALKGLLVVPNKNEDWGMHHLDGMGIPSSENKSTLPHDQAKAAKKSAEKPAPAAKPAAVSKPAPTPQPAPAAKPAAVSKPAPTPQPAPAPKPAASKPPAVAQPVVQKPAPQKPAPAAPPEEPTTNFSPARPSGQ
jgi:pilus assembly protein CpaC